jgi:hypothetical protein
MEQGQHKHLLKDETMKAILYAHLHALGGPAPTLVPW